MKISLMSTLAIPLTTFSSESDIYSAATLGKKTLLLMLDSSAGMDDNGKGQTPARSIIQDYPNCPSTALKEVSTGSLGSIYPLSQALSNGTLQKAIVWGFPACQIGTNTSVVTNYKYSRMDRMKLSMSLLLGNKQLSNDIVMGLGQFSAQTTSAFQPHTGIVENNIPDSKTNVLMSKSSSSNGAGVARSYGNDVSAKILVPASALDGDQRYKMRVAVTTLGSGGSTPLASAIAESGAYMLGTTTFGNNKELVGTFNFDNRNHGPFNASGFAYSHPDTKNGTTYKSPVNSSGCNANGIFLLTNAAPNSVPREEAQQVMRNALNDQTFTCPVSGKYLPTPTGKTDFGWSCIGEFAKRLKQSDKNIKVAVAGFGSNYIPYTQNTNLQIPVNVEISNGNTVSRTYYKCNSIQVGDQYTFDGANFTVKADNIQDIKNACNLGQESYSSNADMVGVGGYGEGGFYPIVSPENLADAVVNFSQTLDNNVTGITAGKPSIPIDSLNSSQVFTSSYYAQIQPNLDQPNGIWIGNLKKYNVESNTYFGKSNQRVFDDNGNFRSIQDFWNTTVNDGGKVQIGGALEKLPAQTQSGRKIYTNREVSGSSASEITTVNTALKLIDAKNTADATGTAEALRASTDVNQTNAYLLNLLGYGVSTPAVPANLTNAPELRQMGATTNSTPLMFTTESKIALKATTVTENGVSVTYNPGDYIDRKDYVLFGTNQGLLQIVDAITGSEKFAFLPYEMIEKQKKGFISKDLQTGSDYTELYQGIDGAWSVYATYIAGEDNNSLKAENLNVYGGLRRGGSNYYGLDLKDIETTAPKLLFKVGPTTGGICSNSAPLNCMGQSWSKPVIAWVKWKGKPQLVMIVGGGYDPVFDSHSYKANADKTKGNGVYIFAANTNTETGLTAGDLMWWGSASAATTTSSGNNAIQQTHHDDLKYSVVSEIKTVDRDNDNFVDHLYFGDLGGQLFRVDLNNLASTETANFNVKRIVRIGNFIEDSERSTKTAPRFYHMPTFTTHRINNMGGIQKATRYAVISIGSGDQSSPTTNTLTQATGLPDRIYGVFDRDVGRTDLYTLSSDTAETDGLLTGTANITNMLDIAITTGDNAASLVNMRNATTKGWFNTLSGSTLGNTTNLDPNVKDGVARYKVLSSFAAISNTLFTSYYDAADKGSTASCSGGVKGRSFIKNYCLPFGNMNGAGENCGTELNGRWFSGATVIGSDVGGGVVPVVVGGMSSSNGNSIGPITTKGANSGVKAEYKIPLRFEPLSWAEKNS